MIKGPNTTETVKDFRGQEKIFVRSLQQDLSMDEVVNSQLVRLIIVYACPKYNSKALSFDHLSNLYMLMKYDAFFSGRRSTGNVL